MSENGKSIETLVARLCREATQLAIRISSPTSDAEMHYLLDEFYTVTTRIAQASAQGADDLLLKLDLLCRRLREDVIPENRGDVLTYLLAESIRDELKLRNARPNDWLREKFGR